jgi:hypothetical protein
MNWKRVCKLPKSFYVLCEFVTRMGGSLIIDDNVHIDINILRSQKVLH